MGVVRLAKLAAVFALLFVAAAMPAFGQNSNACEIRGTVTDMSGAVVPGASVIVANIQTGVVTRLTTNDAGVYNAVSILPGEYTITFAKDGFNKSVRDRIVLHVGTRSVDAQLQIGAVSDEVLVKADPVLLETESSGHNSTLTAKAIVELPNVGGNWMNYTNLLPGVDGSGSNLQVNGTWRYNQNWLIDGGVGTYPVSQNVPNSTPMENIAEVNIITSNGGAQYGNGSAVFNVITKGGTNEFHGSLFERVQNNVFNARNYFAKTVPLQRWNQYGGSIGGPIRKNKTFAFFSYQRNTSRSYSTGFYTFPTTDMRAGDFSAVGADGKAIFPAIYDPNSLATGADGKQYRTLYPGNKIPQAGINSIARAVQDYLPTPNQAGYYNNYYIMMSGQSANTWYTWRIDHQFTDSNRLTASFTHNPDDSFSNDPRCPMNCTKWTDFQTPIQFTDVWTITPTLVNELRGSFLRYAADAVPPAKGQGFPQKLGMKNPLADIFPSMSWSGPVGASSIGPGTSWTAAYNTYAAPSDTLTWIHGKHSLKLGGEYNAYQQNSTAWGDTSSGNFSFDGRATRNPNGMLGGLGYADFLTGQVTSWSVSIGPPSGLRAKNAQFFVQDDYKLLPNLTVNAGLRAEVRTGWSEVNNLIGMFDPSITNPKTGTLGGLWFGGQNGKTALTDAAWDFLSPRLGVAWTPRPTWTVRAGWGKYNQMWGAGNYAAGAGVGLTTSGSVTSTDYSRPAFTLDQGNPAPVVPDPKNLKADLLNGQGLTYIPRDTKIPYSLEWNLSVQHQMASDVVVEVAYVGTHSVHQGFNRDLNAVPLALRGPGNAQSRRAYPQYAAINTVFSDGIASYHAMQASIKKQFSAGLSLQANYTFSKSMDSGTGTGWNGNAGIPDWQNPFSYRDNYGPSAIWLPHIFKADLVYEMPVGKGRTIDMRNPVLNGILGGWQISSIIQVQSGNPFTPKMGTANLNGTLAGNWRPDRLASGEASDPTLQRWFDVAAFAQPAAYTFGNSGRNFLRGPNWKNANLSLAKNFRLPFGEKSNLQIRGDASNAFNHANFGTPNASIGTTGAGIISSASAPRVLQLGARMSF